MAAESCLDVSMGEYNLNAVTQMQALCRGWLVRKKLTDARTEFQQIVHELDGPVMQIEWTESAPPLPIVCKASKKSRRNLNQDHMTSSKQSGALKSNSVKMMEPECPGCTEKTCVYTETESVPESHKLPVNAKPDPDKTQSHQEVQTQFTQTETQLLVSEERQAEDSQCDPLAPDAQENRHPNSLSKNEESVGKDCLEMQKRIVESSGSAQYNGSNIDRSALNVPSSSCSSTSTSFAPVLSSAQTAASPDRLKRTDSFHGDQTSVWDSSSTILQDQEAASKRSCGHEDGQGRSLTEQKGGLLQTGADMTEVTLKSLSTEELLKQRQNVAMELLWVQQAIISRKKYLKLKLQMEVAS